MYKWKIEYVLKNGEHLFGEYHGNENNSASVFGAITVGNENTFYGCKSVDGNGTLFVRNSDIAAINISF